MGERVQYGTPDPFTPDQSLASDIELSRHAADLNLHSSGRRLAAVSKLTATTLPVHASVSSELADFVLPAVVIGSRPFALHFSDGVFTHSAATTDTVTALAFALNGALITNSNFFIDKPAATAFSSFSIRFEHSLAPGTYRFSVFARTGASTGTLNAFGAGKTSFSVIEL